MNAVQKRIHAALVEAQQERLKRPEMVETSDGPEIGWALYERAVMLGVVNEIRSERGLVPVVQADVDRAEHLALGHFDYTEKFALACAELVLRGA